MKFKTVEGQSPSPEVLSTYGTIPERPEALSAAQVRAESLVAGSQSCIWTPTQVPRKQNGWGPESASTAGS